MSSSWHFHNPVRIVFGPGCRETLTELVPGERVLLVTTPGFTRRGTTTAIARLLGERRTLVWDSVLPSPELNELERASEALRSKRANAIVALGGGSAIDSAKVLSLTLAERAHDNQLTALLDGGALDGKETLPFFAIPTTAGSGSEVTPFATVWDRSAGQKHSLHGDSLFPRVALLDPELTLSLPEAETVQSGLDALSQGLEAIWNRNATPVTTALATRAVGIALEILPKLLAELGSTQLRSSMMEASLLSGLAISRTRTALAHSISYPLTARLGVPHGLACSFALPALLKFNADVDDGRLALLARSVGCGSIHGLEVRLLQVLAALGVWDRLQSYALSIEAIRALESEMLTPGRADNNLREVTRDDLLDILGSIVPT